MKVIADYARRKLLPAVADGPRDALCTLKSYRLLLETQLPPMEWAMSVLQSTDAFHWLSTWCVHRIDGRQSRRGLSTVTGAVNKAQNVLDWIAPLKSHIMLFIRDCLVVFNRSSTTATSFTPTFFTRECT